jgi:hypothetical protein
MQYEHRIGYINYIEQKFLVGVATIKMTINDPRFTSIHSDPRFIKPNRKKNKKKEHENEDKRFSAIEKGKQTAHSEEELGTRD